MKRWMVVIGVIGIIGGIYAQQVKWFKTFPTATFDPWGSPYDNATWRKMGMCFDQNGNLYVASAINSDFVVINFNPSTGDTNWIYRYPGPHAIAYAMILGSDGNLYAAGQNDAGALVVCLDLQGNERWTYTISQGSIVSDMIEGNDGNLYCTGLSAGSHLMVASLTKQGNLRWVYTYAGAGNWADYGLSIVYGDDGNIYVGGLTYEDPYVATFEFTVISLTTQGSFRWRKSLDGGALYGIDAARSLVYLGNSIYAAGVISEYGNYFQVVSFDTQGNQQWVYKKPATSERGAYYMITDGLHLYVTGETHTSSTGDMTIVKLDRDGNEIWITPITASSYWDEGEYVSIGEDGNLYVAGFFGRDDSYTYSSFAIACVDTNGNEIWRYDTFNITYFKGMALRVIQGPDGDVYCAGAWQDVNNVTELIVMAISSPVSVAENIHLNMDIHSPKFYIEKKHLHLPLSYKNAILYIYDATGKRVLSSLYKGYPFNIDRLPSGTYIGILIKGSRFRFKLIKP